MSLAWDGTFRNGWTGIGCHTPLVLDVDLGNANATQVSGDCTVEIQGQGNAENQTLYTFDMAYVGTTGTTPNFVHRFILDITDVMRAIANNPLHQVDFSGGGVYDEDENRMFTLIYITAKSAGEGDIVQNNYYGHGFNPINTDDDACLVEFCNKDVVATIPIVPGAPMIMSLWNEVPTAVQQAHVLKDKVGNTLNSRDLATASIIQGLIQICDPVNINQELYDEYENPETFTLHIYDSATKTTEKHKLYLAAWKKACEGDVLLAWLNRYGTYSYMAFERFATYKTNQKSMGSYNLQVIGISALQSRKASRGYSNVQTVISAVAKAVPTEFFPIIEDLFYSMDVYYFIGTLPEYEFDSQEWLRVTVGGSLTERKKYNHENVRIDVMLPEKYTQVR